MTYQLQAVIFDFNGVIVDDEPLHFELFQQVLAEAGLPLTKEDYQAKYLGYDDCACFAMALRAGGRAAQANEAAFIAQLVARKAARYQRAISKHCSFFPGAIELTRRLAAQWPLAIASGALRSEIETVLARGGIRDCFQAIIAAEDTTRCKPDPEGYCQALAALNARRALAIQPGACLVLEDSIAGVAAAKAAGMRCLAITNTYTAEALHQADWVAASLVDCAPEKLFKAL